jgi:AraC-like DNA-binding protein
MAADVLNVLALRKRPSCHFRVAQRVAGVQVVGMSVAEAVSVVRPAAVPDVELLIIDNSERAWKVYHETYTFAAARMRTKVADWWYRGKLYAAIPNVSALLEPGELHVTKRVYAPCDVTAIQVRPSVIVEAARELGIASTPHFSAAQCALPGFNDALLSFTTAVERGATALEQQTLLYECIGLAFQQCVERRMRPMPRDDRGAQLAREYIRAHAPDHISLDELAVISGLSRFHLVRSFSRLYGLPPHAYQTSLRIAAAREALRSGVPLSQLDLGFADQSHLSRYFKRDMVMTPGRYATAVLPPSFADGAATVVRDPASVQHHARRMAKRRDPLEWIGGDEH